MSEISNHKEKSVFTLASELSDEQRDFLLNLPPNVDPQMIVDAGLGDAVAVCYYGTLMPDKVAGSYVDGAVEAMEPATIEGYNLYSHSRGGKAFGDETFPHLQPAENGNATPVHGYLFKLKDAPKLDSDGNPTDEFMTIADRIKYIDEYEELPAGMYERRIIPVKNSDDEEVLAMVYVGTEKLPSRTYKLPETDDSHIEHDDPRLDTEEFGDLTDPQGNPQTISVKKLGGTVMMATSNPDDKIADGSFSDYLSRSKKQ